MSEGNVLLPDDLALKKDHVKSKKDILNVENLEKEAIIEAMQKCKGNMSLASQKLGLSRSTLYRKMKKYDI